MRLVALLFLGLLTGATLQAAEPVTADPFSVKGIAVDVVAGNATQAREAGFRQAQRAAWRQLWARLTGQAESSAPSLGDSTLSELVAGIDVESERFSSKRYIARLAVDFDPVPLRTYISQLGLGPQGRKSHPILLLPVLKDGGAWMGVDPRSPWFQAWTAFGDVRSAIDYVRVTGTPGDAVLLGAPRASEQSAEMMRLALLRYGAEDFAVAEARLRRSFPGGPVEGRFRILHGMEGQVLGEARLTAASPAGVPAMLAEAVRVLDGALNKALERSVLKAGDAISVEELIAAGPEEAEQSFGVQSFRGIDVLVETPDAQSWSVLEARLRRVPSVSGLTLVALSLGGVSQMRLDYGASVNWLHYDLDQIGLRLAPTGDGRWLLRPRRAGDPQVEMPVIVEGVGEEDVVTQEPGAPRPGVPQQPVPQQPAPPQPAQPQPVPPVPPEQAPNSLLPPNFGQRPPQE